MEEIGRRAGAPKPFGAGLLRRFKWLRAQQPPREEKPPDEDLLAGIVQSAFHVDPDDLSIEDFERLLARAVKLERWRRGTDLEAELEERMLEVLRPTECRWLC